MSGSNREQPESDMDVDVVTRGQATSLEKMISVDLEGHCPLS